MSNFRKIDYGIYLVRTQAGFNQALKDYHDELPNRGYPKSYPSLVTFAVGYEGYLYIAVRSIHVNRVIEELSDE